MADFPAAGAPAGRVALVGVHGGQWFGRAAARAVGQATVVVASRRHLGATALPAGARREELAGDLGAVLDRVDSLRRAGERVCLLLSGDPGFFGLARLAGARLGCGALEVHPAPPAVSLAWGRAGVHWDDAVVVSAHGRSPEAAVEAVHRHPKVAVMCAPDVPPERLGGLILAAGPLHRDVTVAARLGEEGEALWSGTVEGLAAGAFDPLSVVLFMAGGPVGPPGTAWAAWGRPESEFEHRAGMITKAEVRAVALGKLAVPAAGVMWDVGAGSGSVSVECARLAPGLRIFAVERRDEDLGRLTRNLAGTAATVVPGAAPAVLAGLPSPDRAFVGGGGVAALDAVLERLRPGGRIVATYSSPERAGAAYRRLGHMVQVSVNQAVPTGADGSFRLAAQNPVFVCWGPQP